MADRRVVYLQRVVGWVLVFGLSFRKRKRRTNSQRGKETFLIRSTLLLVLFVYKLIRAQFTYNANDLLQGPTQAPMHLFNITKQFSFYGAYHSDPVNVRIHIIFVPLILWTAQVLFAFLPIPSFFPTATFSIAPYLTFKLNWGTMLGITFQSYYFLLEPLAALIYLPQMTLSTLTAAAFSTHPLAIPVAGLIHVVSWIAQFIGHGVHEGRAPALLDNLFGALFLAPFFVHLELLFRSGYKPALHKTIMNEIGKEIALIRKKEGDKKRAAQKAGN